MKNLYFILLLLIPNILFGQTYKLPEVIPPSPQASEFVKYIDFPIDLSSGLPSIDVPIYTVRSEELVLPISLSYHASGLKPNEDESGIIGLGWHLNASGIVTRSINRQPDEKYWNYLIPQESSITSNTNNLEADPDATILDNIARGYKESEPDVFNYSLPGAGGGKFVFKRSATQSEFLKPVTLPYKPVKITPSLTQENGVAIFGHFEIKDEKGVLYRFGESLSNNQIVNEKYFDVNDNQKKGITSWLLTEIISADKSDTIYFEYDDVLAPGGGTTIVKSHHGFSRSYSITRHQNQGTSTGGGPNGVFTSYGYTQKKLTNIKFKSGYVRFFYESDVYPNQLLERIEIYSNRSGSPTKTIRLSQTKYHNNASLLNWHKLDNLKFYDSNNDEVNKYNFYYNTSDFPPIHENYTNETFAIDFWGYFNGATWNTDLMPSFEWKPLANAPNLFGSAIRSPNYQHAMKGILTRMVNPTGGEHIFEYEGNRNYLSEPVGGLRIRSITNRTNGQEIKKTFTYHGFSVSIDQSYFQSHSADVGGHYLTDIFTAYSDPRYSVTINGNPVLYTRVTEYIGDETTNKGHIEHHYDATFTGSLKYDYWSIPRGFPWINGNGQFSYGPLQVCYYDVIFGNVFEKETKIFNSTGNLVKTVNNYYSHDLKQRLNGFTVNRVVSTTELPNKAYFFIFYNYNIDQLAQKLDSSVTVNYNGGTEIVEREIYSYNDYLFLNEKKSQNSDGSWNISKYKYPNDFSAQAPYNDMVNNRNIIAPVIEQLNYEGTKTEATKHLQSVKTNYRDWGSNVIAPDWVGVKTGTSSTYEERVSFIQYDNKGNLLWASKDGGPDISYIWGYNHTLPIAKVDNAKYVRGNLPQMWMGDFSYTGVLNVDQRYQLNGSCYFPTNVNVSITREFYKQTHDEITATTYIYDSNNQLVTTFTDHLVSGNYHSFVSNNINMPAGAYSAEVKVYFSEGVNSNMAINVSLDGSGNIYATVPFHTSFEDDNENGSGDFSKTGKKSHQGSYVVRIPPATNDVNQVIVSYWSKVTSTHWQYHKEVVNADSELTTKTIGSSSGYIDDVCVYPVGSQMTTYTYDPLIGITSATDPNGKTTYYYYDSFGRLDRIEDNDHNVIEKYKYNYAN